jgi:hypothetical protein
MKHLKLYESFNNIESTKEELYDLFIDFEDDKWTVKPLFSKIVKDRNDWTGNFQSTKVRRVFGQEFIDYNKDVIMSKDGKTWTAQDAFIVNMSKIHYIKPEEDSNPYSDKSFEDHWNSLDEYIVSKLPVIQERSKRLGLELLGVVGKWFTLGKASHSDYSNEPYFGWYMLTDLISFAFVPIKTNEGLFDFFKRYKDYFTEEESVKIESQLSIQQLVKWTPVLEGHKIKSIEIYIGGATRSSLSPQYLLITKQDSQYKLITFQDVHRFAGDNTAILNRYKTLDEVILEAKKYIMYCLVAPFITKPSIIEFKWNSIQVIESQFNESKSLIEDYSILKNDNKLNLERLNMLLDDYSISRVLQIPLYGKITNARVRNNEDRLISILKNYFK